MRIKTIRVNFSLVVLVIALLGFFTIIALQNLPVFASQPDQEHTEDLPFESDDESFVVIHDLGKKTTIKTSATTVADLLQRAKITLDPFDIVEPALDEEIISRDFRINIYRARPVIVLDGIRKYSIMTAKSDPREIVSTANLSLRAEDSVKISAQDHFLEAGIAVTYEIIRAKLVRFNFYGQSTEVYSQAKTISEFFNERNIVISDQDWVSLPIDTLIQDHLELSLYRQGVDTVTLSEKIPFPIKKVYDYDRPVGYRAISEPGVEGLRSITYEVHMFNGVEQSRREIASVVTQEPKNQIEIFGAKYRSASILTRAKGVNHFIDSHGISHRETYYDLPMSLVMQNCGEKGYYTVRSDGVKVDSKGYVIIAAHLSLYPRCSIVETSLGLAKVYDTGSFTSVHPHGFDIATDWTKKDGI